MYSTDLRTVEGDLFAGGGRFAIVRAKWNGLLSEQLLDGAVEAFVRHGVARSDILVVQVPGSFEIPLAVRELASKGGIEAVVAVGVIMRGQTDHYELLSRELSSALGWVMRESSLPVTFGVVVANELEDVINRVGAKFGNKGWEAALAAIEMASVLRKLRKRD